MLKGEFQVDKVTLVNREIPIRVRDTKSKHNPNGQINTSEALYIIRENNTKIHIDKTTV